MTESLQDIERLLCAALFAIGKGPDKAEAAMREFQAAITRVVQERDEWKRRFARAQSEANSEGARAAFAVARIAVLEKALRDATGDKPMLTVRCHKGDDVIVDAKELLRFVKFRIDGPRAALSTAEEKL